ncbi:stage III sporulation protein AB [Marininema mesophilum]|uniref:Stage III sporulation protein AB n=1 Tax=Marininema mesophilum TaxID=1048340 RepID=A0A1H2UAS4_9BACL|nr:stage III sporulation protein SpoIIIAB [Marininema mesophilum]SDW53236.1 stage III sporulation protein AB [Marininema mesophilum]
MLKLMGAALILLSSSAVGFQAARSYAERPRQIRQMLGAFAMLETEITYGARRLDEICNHLAQREKDPVRSLFARCAEYLSTLDGVSTYDCWKRAVEEIWPTTLMKAPEKEVLIDFGKTLGVSDRADQMQHIQRAKTNLGTEESRALEEQTRYEKMCRSLGVLAGVLIVILIY